jgi:hypothetical protein
MRGAASAALPPPSPPRSAPPPPCLARHGPEISPLSPSPPRAASPAPAPRPHPPPSSACPARPGSSPSQFPLPPAPPPSGWIHRHPLAPHPPPRGARTATQQERAAPLASHRRTRHLAAHTAPVLSRPPTRPAATSGYKPTPIPTCRHLAEHPPRRARRAEHQLPRAADSHRAAHGRRNGGRQEDRGVNRRPARQPPLEPPGPSRRGTVTRTRKTSAWAHWAPPFPTRFRLRPVSRTKPSAQPPNSVSPRPSRLVQHGPRQRNRAPDHHRDSDLGPLLLHHSPGTALRLSHHRRRQMGRCSLAPSGFSAHNTNPRNQRLRTSDCVLHKSSKTSHRTPWGSCSATCA